MHRSHSPGEGRARHTGAMTDVRGLVPIGVDPNAKTVTLADVEPSEFSEPFFEYTTRRLRANTADKLLTVAWQDLIDQSTTWPDTHEVSTLVFNVGRCGSTMLANMLKAHPGLWVLSEPEPLAKPELVARRTQTLAARTETEALYRANSLLLQYRAAEFGQQLVVKYPSWLAARAPAMAANHPKAAVIGLYRTPREVVASYIAKPPAFADGMHAPAAVQMSVTPALATIGSRPLTGAAYYAAIWVSTMVGAMAVEKERLLLLDYAQLKDDAAGCVDPIIEHLGLSVSTDEREAILETTRHYAKPRSAEQVTFDPSGTHARPQLSPRTLAEVDQVVGDLEQTLRNHPRHLEFSP